MVAANKEATEPRVPLSSWIHHFESFTVATMTWLTVMEYLCHKWPRICYTCRRVSLVEQKLLILPEHLSSTLVFSGVRVTRSLALCVCFIVLLSFFFWPFCCLFFFDIRILITPLVSSNSFCFNVQLHCFLYPGGGALCSNILFDLVTSVFVILTCVGQLDIVFVPFFLFITKGK
jgi:hypothetical protein